MKVRATVLAALLGAWAVFLSANAPAADPGKEADLQARIGQLEKRVAELERTIRQLRASVKEEPRTETENKLVGTWVVADADRKTALFSDLKLKGDWTCSLAFTAGTAAITTAKYQVIGKQIVIDGGTVSTWECRIASVNGTELVLEQRNGNETVKIHYTREK